MAVPPAPMDNTAIDVTPVGTTQEYVPAVVYVAQVAIVAVMLFEALLRGPVKPFDPFARTRKV